MNNLLLKKLALAFVLGFMPVFLGGLTTLFDQIANHTSGSINSTFLLSLLAGLISGAIAAGIRGVLAVFTDSFDPTDKLHGVGTTPDSVVVTKEG